MKKLILLTTLLLTVSCGVRKAQKYKSHTETVTAVSTDSTSTVIKKTYDAKENVTAVTSIKLNESLSWKYEAPQDDITYKFPVWLKVGRDSVDVSKLPKGAKLTVKTTRDSVRTDSLSMLKTLRTENDSLRTELRKRQDGKTVTNVKTSDVERESQSWYVTLVCIVAGIVLYSAIPHIFKLIKKSLL